MNSKSTTQPNSRRYSTTVGVHAMSKLFRTNVGRVRSPTSCWPMYRSWYGASTSMALRTRRISGAVYSGIRGSCKKNISERNNCTSKPLLSVIEGLNRSHDHEMIAVLGQHCRRAPLVCKFFEMFVVDLTKIFRKYL